MTSLTMRRLLSMLGIGSGKIAGTTRGMSARDRRALIAGVVAIGSLITLSRGLPAWRAWRQAVHEEAIASATDIARARSLLGVSGAIGDSLAARNDRFLALAPALLGGESPAAAGATLAGIVSGAAATSGVRLGAIQIRPDTASSETFTRVSVRADATGDITGVMKMLTAIERGPTLLAVRSLSIDQSAPAATSDRMEALRVSLVVEGLMLTPRAVESPANSSSPRADTPSSRAADSSTAGSP
jgi:hypothetical protein